MEQGTAVIGRIALKRVQVGPGPVAPRDLVAGTGARPPARLRDQDDQLRAALEAVMAYLASA